MPNTIKVRKGLNIRIKGEADKVLVQAESPDLYALKPTDFHGLIPKLELKEGAEVKVGTPIFHNKENSEMKFVSPVSGEIAEVKRGAKRKILAIKILADKEMKYEDFGKSNPNELNREEIIQKLLISGTFPFIKKRPLDIIANPEEMPKAIFVSGFDSSPLAPDFSYILEKEKEALQTGFDALKKLTEGKVYLSVRNEGYSASVFSKIQGAEVNYINGPHPAGNVGLQIHKINPINKGETIWTINIQDIVAIGNLFLTGQHDSSKTIIIAGAEAKSPKYYKIIRGSHVKAFKNEINEGNVRLVGGSVLTGTQLEEDDFLGFYDNMLTAIEEGDRYKMLLKDGWLSLGFKKFSLSRTYPTWLMPKSKKFDVDTNTNGEERAFVVTGQYEQVFPFDIYPVQLIKAAMIGDIDAMEGLGIYEVAPEDFALCEYVCTSKINSQNIIREGLDLIKKELF